MASGRQIAEENFKLFNLWVSSKSDRDFQTVSRRGILSRKEIAIECGFAKSALDQNPRIKAALRELEDKLRLRGVLEFLKDKTAVEPSLVIKDNPNLQHSAIDIDRVCLFQKDNIRLNRELAEAKRALEKYNILFQALRETGRVIRC